MKRVCFILISAFVIVCSYAQRKDITERMDMDGVLTSDYESFSKGAAVKLMGMTKLKSNREDMPQGIFMIMSINNTQVPVPTYKANLFDLKPQNMEEFWTWMFIKNGMYEHYDKKGYRYELRKEISEESKEYLNEISNLFYDDAYIQDYIRTIFTGIIPQNLNNNKRPEIPNIEIVRSPAPDSYILPNGTIIITTGLLSALDSVEELTAIIANESAHYVLDHHLINTAKEISRARRAEFWGSILTGVAAGVEYALAEDNEYYVPGGVFIAADVATAAIAGQISNRLGMTYSKKQIKQADDIAIEFLKFANMEPSALVSALSKIKNYYESEKAFADLNEGDLKDLQGRIEQLGKEGEIKDFSNRIYQKTMSGVTTFNAIIHQNTKNFATSERLAQKNIDNNLASVDDYVIVIKSNMNRTNSPEANEKNLQLIEKVKGMTLVPNLNLNKQEILLLLRMDKQAKASAMLKEYVSLLSDYQKQASGDDFNWAASEINWANNLYQRIGLF